MKANIPNILSKHLLPFNWDVKLIWALQTQAKEIERIKLDYLLDLPFWTSIPKKGMLFDISPKEVLESPERAPHQLDRIIRADIAYPIDMLDFNQSLWILDGVHRLAKLYMTNTKIVNVRVHSSEVIPQIKIL